MSDLREKIVGNATGQLASALDREIKAVLDAFWETWTTDDIKKRCILVSYHGGECQVLHADGVPLLEVYPMKTRHEILDDRYVVHITQNFRRLPVAAGDAKP